MRASRYCFLRRELLPRLSENLSADSYGPADPRATYLTALDGLRACISFGIPKFLFALFWKLRYRDKAMDLLTKESPMTDHQVEASARMFGVLSEPTRLFLLRALMPGAASVGELVETTGFKQGTVSKHLGILHRAGFLARRRDGAQIFYEISDPTVRELCGLMCDRMRRDVARQYENLAH